MRISKTESFTVLGKDEFSRFNPAGIDTFKGIIILFDDHFDQRVFLFLKQNFEGIRPCVKAVMYTKGHIMLFCHHTPNAFTLGLEKNMVEVGGADTWSVELIKIYEGDGNPDHHVPEPYEDINLKEIVDQWDKERPARKVTTPKKPRSIYDMPPNLK